MFLGGELFKQGPRPAAMSFSGMLNWLANFVVGITFPFILVSVLKYYFTIKVSFFYFLLLQHSKSATGFPYWTSRKNISQRMALSCVNKFSLF